MVGRPARTFGDFSVSVPLLVGKPDLSVPRGLRDFLISVITGAGIDDVDSVDDVADEANDFTRGAEFMVIVSSWSPAWLSASSPTSDAAEAFSSSSSIPPFADMWSDT